MHTQSGIALHSRFQSRFIFRNITTRFIVHPQLDVLLPSIRGNAVEIEICIGLHIIEVLRFTPVLPAFVPPFEQHSLNIVRRCEVNMTQSILRRRSMPGSHCPCMGAEMQSPPYADIFLRFDPRSVSNLRRLVQVKDQRRVDQVHRFVSHLDRPPRRHEFRGNTSLYTVRQRSQLGFEGQRIGPVEIHFGEIVQRRFVNRTVCAVHTECERRIGVFDGRNRQFAIQQFIGVEISRNRPRHAVFGEAEFGQFIGDGQRIEVRHLPFIAECHTVVKSPETKRQQHAVVVFQYRRHFVVAIAQDFIFAPRLRPCFVHGPFHNLPYRKAAGEVPFLHHEAQGRRKDQRFAVAFDGIGHAAVGARHERKACAPVGRNYLRIPAACKQKQAHTGQKQVPERELQSLVHAKFI